MQFVKRNGVLTFRQGLGILSRFMASIVEKLIEIETVSGATVRGDLRWDDSRLENQGTMLPVAVVCHGFKAFKDWGPFPFIGRYFAEKGFASIVMNFSHNGIGREPRKFVEHEKFSRNTISLEIDDVKAVLDELSAGAFGCRFIDTTNVSLIGHSRGGAVCIITGREDARVKNVVAWSTISRFNRYTEEQRRRWREKGFVQLHSMNGPSLFKIGTALLDDVEQNAERLDILQSVRDLKKPFLILHGTADIPAKIEEAQELYDVSDKALTEFIALEGVGHMYGAKHPYKTESPTLLHVLDLTTQWLLKQITLEV